MSSDAIAIQTAEAAGRPWVETLHEWVTTVDHKRLGILYILYALVFLIIGGIEATIIRIQLMRPHNDFVSPQVFNRMFTMHGTTMIFFVAMPILFGFANYLVPLMIGARDLACVFSRSQRGLLDDCVAGLGVRQHLHGDQHHCNHSLYAMSRDEAQPDAAAGLVEPGHGRDGYPGRIASYRSSDHAFDRPLPWRALLRYAGRRLCNPLDALLLDLRASGSLRSDYSGLRLCIRDHSSIFAQTDLWIPRHGSRNDLHWVHRFERLGASHVHDRDEFLRQQLFCVYDNGYRGPYRHQDLQLARHDVGRKDPVQDADDLLHRIPAPVPDRRAYRRHDVCCTLRLATRQLLLCRCPFPLRDRGRDPVLPFRRVLLLVSENHGKAIERNPGQTPFLALRDRFSPDV